MIPEINKTTLFERRDDLVGRLFLLCLRSCGPESREVNQRNPEWLDIPGRYSSETTFRKAPAVSQSQGGLQRLEHDHGETRVGCFPRRSV